jgi:capsular exopolysaccharide synthesis family protein
MVPLSVHGDHSADKEEGFSIHPHQLWAAFCRHWFLSVILGMLAAAPVAYLAWKRVPTPYRAEAEIIIRANRPKIGFELPEDRENFKVLKSREMQRVKHPDTLARALAEDGIAQLATLKEIPGEMDEPYWLRNNLSVQNSGEETFTISLEGEYPEELPKIVNSVKDAYLGELHDEVTRNSTDRFEEINKQLNTLEASIKEKQEAIKDLSAKAEGSSSTQQDLQRENDLLKMSELQAEMRSIDLEILELRSQLDSEIVAEQSQESTEKDNLPSTVKPDASLEEQLDRAIRLDPRYTDLEKTIEQLEHKIAFNKKRLNSESLPEITGPTKKLQEKKKELDELQASLKEEYWQKYLEERNRAQGIVIDTGALQRKIQVREAHRGVLQKELHDLKIEDEKKIEIGVDLDLLRDALGQDQKFAERLKDQKSTLLIEKNAKERIEENYPAEIPKQRETRKRNMLAAGGGLGAFGFVVALFTLLELRFMRVSSLKLLEQKFDFPILGTIPRLPVKVLQSQQNTRKAAVYKHTFTEAIDSVRTVLLNQQKKTPMTIIMVTSALGGEGKSTLSSHLAISFARAGRKTLLIDGDLRRPRVHDVFGIPDFPGFCEALRGETPFEKCTYESGVSGLDIMPAGEVDPFTLRTLAEPETHSMLSALRDEYDLVLFDSAPILPVADSLLIMQSIDGVLLSIRKDHSRMSKVTAALKKINLVGGKLFGGIVIGINEAEYGYRGSYYGKNATEEAAAVAND